MTKEKLLEYGTKKKLNKLEKYLTGSDVELREVAYEAVGSIQSEDAMNRLIAGINDSSPKVRLAIAKSLCKIGKERASEHIRLRIPIETDKEMIDAFEAALQHCRKV